jgi:predicted ATPase
LVELIVARIDSMRATDQLMIKCAAVLGKVVRRDILEILLPKAHRPKLAGTIHRLMESGIFTCSKSPTSQMAVRGVQDELKVQQNKCFCHRSASEMSTMETNSCYEPMFTHPLLQETAYEVLMESQRNELHTKAAQYLELSADELRGHIPYYVLFRPPADDLEEQAKMIELKLAGL